MEFTKEVMLGAIKESAGTLDNGRSFSSTTFYLEADLKSNSAGRSMGRIYTPFKCGDATEFEKWAKLEAQLPMKVSADFDMQADQKGVAMVLVGIRPAPQQRPAPQVAKA